MPGAPPSSGPQELSLWKLVFPSRGTFALALATTILAAGSSTGLMAMISEIVSDPPEWASGTLFAIAALMAVGSGFVAQFVTAYVIEITSFRLRVDLLQRVLKLPYPTIERLGPGRMSKAMTSDLFTVSMMGPQVVHVTTQGATIVGCLAYLAWTSWQLLIWVLPALLASGLLILMPRLASKWIAEGTKLEENMFEHFNSTVEGAKELKMDRARRDGWLISEVTKTLMRRRELSQRVWSVFILLENLSRLLPVFVIGALLFLLAPTGNYPRPDVVAFVFTILYMVQPIRGLAQAAQAVSRARIALQRVIDLNVFNQDVEPLDSPEAKAPPDDDCELIYLRQVMLEYPKTDDDRQFTVGPLDLRIEPGEVTFIVGGNGSGKTTLIKILTGLYAPTSGTIQFNGETITNENRDWYRQHIAAVFADFYLFENLHCDAATEERVRQYLVRLRLDHKVSIKDGELSTLDLSAGQRRRLALIAALINDRPICVFDEWAADQDPEFKQFFYEQFLIELKRKNKVVIAITHDDRYFGVADRLVKLEDGLIVQTKSEMDYEVTNQQTMEGMLHEVVGQLSKLPSSPDVDELIQKASEYQSVLLSWRKKPPSPERKYRVVAEVMAVIGEASRIK